MSTRCALALVSLVAFALIPLTGCTPPASQDVQFVSSGGTVGGVTCCPGSTAVALPGTTGPLFVSPSSTAGPSDLAIVAPSTTASQ